MSIISDALKKVEGNSAASPSKKKGEGPQVELVEAFTPVQSPPLFSIWSILLSTIMVLTAAVLLFVTWYMNRPQRASESVVDAEPISPPVEVAVVAQPEPPAPVVEPEPVPEPAPGPAPKQTPPDVEPPAPAVESEPPAVKPKPEETTVAAAPAAPASDQPATKPAPAPKPKAPVRGDELVLTGVIYTPRVRMAHINGKILPEGAEIKGYRIVTISRESVRLSKDDKFYILRLKR